MFINTSTEINIKKKTKECINLFIAICPEEQLYVKGSDVDCTNSNYFGSTCMWDYSYSNQTYQKKI